MQFPTSPDQLDKTLGAMQDQGFSKEQMQSVYDEFKKRYGASSQSFLGKATQEISKTAENISEPTQEKLSGVQEDLGNKTGIGAPPEVAPPEQPYEPKKIVSLDKNGLYVNPLAPVQNILNSAVEGGKEVVQGAKEQVQGFSTPSESDKIGTGFQKEVSGTLSAAFSPISGLLESAPGGEHLAKLLSVPRDLVGWMYEKAAESAGVDTKSESFLNAKDQIKSAFDVGTLVLPGTEIGKKVGEAVKEKITTPILKKTGEVLKDSAKKNYEKVFNPTTDANKVKTQEIVKKIASGEEQLPSAMSRQGLLEKVSEVKKSYGENVGAAKGEPVVDVVTGKPILDPKTGKPMVQSKIEGATETNKLLDWINEKKTAITQEGKPKVNTKGKPVLDKSGNPVYEQAVIDPDAMKVLNGIEKTINQLGDVDSAIPNAKLQSLKEKIDTIVNKSGGYDKSLAENTTIEINKDFRDVLRDEIAKDNPLLDALNKKYSFYKNVEKVLSDTVKRKTGQSNIVGKGGSALTGAVIGKTGFTSLIGATTATILYGLFSSTGWRMVSAEYKTKLADAILKGKKTAINKVTSEILRKYGPALVAGGEVTQKIEDKKDLQ